MASPDAPPSAPSSSDAFAAAAKDVHLPTFSTADATTWFLRAEIQFRLKNVTTDSRKADFVMAALPEGLFPKIAHYLRRLGNAPVSYNALKARLLKECVPSPEERAARFIQLSRQSLGDQRPSTAYREMQSLLELPPDSDGSFKTIDLLRVFWLNRLPDTVRRSITNFVDVSEDDILQLSDALHCAATPAQLPVCSTSDAMAASSTPDDDLKSSEDEPLAAAATWHKSSSRQFSNSSQRFGNKGFGSRRFNNRTTTHPQPPRGNAPTMAADYCYYHSRFGREARNCRPPCSWPKNL